ncbi:MAG: hypothetical protein Q9N68_02580 [Gammaproteobacteria bacterium]|nr:hypothetical protein [Gammaproteobacteria bacterium]
MMLKKLVYIPLSIFLFSLSTLANATLDKQQIDGSYHSAVAERGARGPTRSKLIQLAKLGNKTVIATAACQKGCTPAIYSHLAEESKTLGHEIFFNAAGLYLIQLESKDFLVVQADGILGKKAWQKIGFANLYSKDQTSADQAAKAKGLESYKQLALDLSSKIMNQEVVQMAHGSGEYHFAVPRKHAGKSYTQRPIEFIESPKKRIEIAECPKCGKDAYDYRPDESAIIGVPVYRETAGNRRNYLFDSSDGILVWARYTNNEGLGKSLWGEHDHYNVFAKDKNYIRQLISQKEKQAAVDAMLTDYSQQVKTVFDQRRKAATEKKIANQELPKQGLKDSSLETEALAAAQRWADSYHWKETLTKAYFTGSSWSMKRNVLSGILTGRAIAGVVVMQRPDGVCSFHYVTFGQQYNGTEYVNTHMIGLTPGQYKLVCNKT